MRTKLHYQGREIASLYLHTHSELPIGPVRYIAPKGKPTCCGIIILKTVSLPKVPSDWFKRGEWPIAKLGRRKLVEPPGKEFSATQKKLTILYRKG